MHLRLFICCCLALLFRQITTHAQDTARTNSLNEITVTASRFPQSQRNTGKVVTILDRQYLEHNAGRSLTSLLNTQAGIVVNGTDNNPGSVAEVYTRGASNGNTLILVDGIPVTDASSISNAFDLNFINTEQIERIEILKGSQSTLYGSDAVAGVINIITRKPGNGKTGAQAGASYGSFNTWQAYAGIGGAINKFSYLLGYKFDRSAGFSAAYDSSGKAGFDKDGLKRHSAFAKLSLQLSPRWQLQYLLNYGKYNTDTDAASFIDDKDYTVENNFMLHALKSRYDFAKGSWNIIYSYQRNKRSQLDDSTDIPNSPFPTKFFPANYTAHTHQLETFVHWDVTNQLKLVAGAEFRTSNTEQLSVYLGAWPGAQPDTSRIGQDSAITRQFSQYAALILHNLNGLTLEIGGRFNYHNIYGNNQTISFNPSYLIADRHKIFVNISSAYKTPTLYQLYSAQYGNRALKPEATVNYEAGYQATLLNDKLSIRTTAFRRDTRDVMLFTNKYTNADKQAVYGGELEANWQIRKDLNLTLNYTYLDGKLTQKDTAYNNLLRKPRHAINASLAWQATKALYIATQLRSVGKRWDYAFPASVPLNSYVTIDIYGEYKLGKTLKVFADFRNITDQKYFDIYGYNTRRFNFTTGFALNI